MVFLGGLIADEGESVVLIEDGALCVGRDRIVGKSEHTVRRALGR